MVDSIRIYVHIFKFDFMIFGNILLDIFLANPIRIL